jgi:hypothetical protein
MSRIIRSNGQSIISGIFKRTFTRFWLASNVAGSATQVLLLQRLLALSLRFSNRQSVVF